MNRLDLLQKLLECSIEDSEKSIEEVFGRMILHFEPLYVFYDILKNKDMKVLYFETPIIEDNEITFIFKTDAKNIKKIQDLHKKKLQYKESGLFFKISLHTNRNILYISLTKLLKQTF